jgi:hypothetical protein
VDGVATSRCGISEDRLVHLSRRIRSVCLREIKVLTSESKTDTERMAGTSSSFLCLVRVSGTSVVDNQVGFCDCTGNFSGSGSWKLMVEIRTRVSFEHGVLISGIARQSSSKLRT